MKDRYLTKRDLAVLFQTKWDRAASILKERGVSPVDLGCGRGYGLRWLESAVLAAMKALHSEAQQTGPQPGKKAGIRPKTPGLHLADMTAAEIHQLISPHILH